MKESDFMLNSELVEKHGKNEFVGSESVDPMEKETAIGKIQKGIDIVQKEGDNLQKTTMNFQKDNDSGQKDTQTAQATLEAPRDAKSGEHNEPESIGTALVPKSINLHITQRCNYHCEFCFAKYFEMRQELDIEQWNRLISELVRCGCEKINIMLVAAIISNLERIFSSIGPFFKEFL